MQKLESTSILNHVYDTQKFRKTGHELIDTLANYLEDVTTNKDQPVIPYTNPEEELEYWKQDFASNSDISDVFKNIINRSIHVHHPRNMGHQVAVPAPISALTGLISDLLSNGTGVYEMGIASNAIEKIITDFVSKKIGFTSNASGFLTSGGTLANLTALLASRKTKAPNDVWNNGTNEKLAILVSEEAHYCIDRAARIMGLGDEGIIKVPVNEYYKIDIKELEHSFSLAQSKGLHVIAVIGCACSTATGSYDNLKELANFATKHDIWFHVDGAHGAAVVFSNQYKHLINGIEHADSVAIDFHKMLMTPALNTALLFKNADDAYSTFAQKAQYLWESQNTREWYNSGKRTFECTKFMMSIKVYSILKTYGTEVFEENVDHLYKMARVFAKMLEDRTDFELFMTPEANIVNFRYIQSENGDLNTLNSNIRKRLLESGKFYIVQTTINDNLYLRTTLMNPLTTEQDLLELLEEINIIALTSH
ncbi:pyridoxal phosphate-dependent decarboxylase family protein [Aquimarina algicola]|uniref:Aminotransferase class I/II-fold pyridoxal phosphate-dependent enzyme n=1 Tax=Aquimarina algicola TaxID=2589995 RepID=A0A504JDA9_9FLAO|nr:aminotransferase class I/II-fold pyridoxal phosphate-dependent enzyme [Aquimarina algicola]TPN89006.1 aminotransferase class I/II-fold pyridoxal phosphate-dependent enzyme [Aquimarina algicola]